MVEVDQDSRIWLANTGPQPIRIEENEVVAMAECVTQGRGTSPGDDRNGGDEVSGLVERAAPHLTEEECQQLRTAMAARRHLFAAGKGDLGRTDIVKYQIHVGDQPAIKQRVRCYPAPRQEEERQLVEDSAGTPARGVWAVTRSQRCEPGWTPEEMAVRQDDDLDICPIKQWKRSGNDWPRHIA